MKTKVISSLLVVSLATGLQAGGDIGGVVSIENEAPPVEVKAPVKIEPKKVVVVAPKKVEEKVVEASKFYVVGKGIYITGDNADSGMGGGLDLGYKFTDSLAVEVGGAYTKNTIDGTTDKSSYKNGAISLVYTLQATDSLGIFAKAGYMMEQVHDEDDSGISYGGGITYGVSDTASIVAEYQGSNIDDSTRGDAISLGLMYSF